MDNCQECKSRLYPDNPTVSFYDRRQRIYLKPTCYYCPEWERETPESTPRIVEHIHRHSAMGKKEFDLLAQTARKVDYLLKKRSNKVVGKKSNKYIIKS